MMAAESELQRQRRFWNVVLYGPFAVGIAALLLGSFLGFELAGSVLYLLGIVGGMLGALMADRRAEVTLNDERTEELAFRASHYTFLTLVAVGLAVFPVLFVLEAAGRFTFDPLATGILWSFSALGLCWGAYYTVLTRRS